MLRSCIVKVSVLGYFPLYGDTTYICTTYICTTYIDVE